jgi:hypothetical protein
MKRFDRTRMTDADVAKRIEQELAIDPRAKKSVLLRRLRDEGFACEQKRFGSIFDEVARRAR